MKTTIKIVTLFMLTYLFTACCSHEPSSSGAYVPEQSQFNPYAPTKYPSPNLNQNVW